MPVGAELDFDFQRWLAARRGSQEQQAREGAAYAYAGERSFRRTLAMARPVSIAIEATTRLWRDSARTELLGSATKVDDSKEDGPLARVWRAAKKAAESIRVRVPPVFATQSKDIRVKVLGTEDAPHLVVNLAAVETLTDTELVAAIGHELGHVQNGHIMLVTALHYLTHGAAFFVRWMVQPAIITLQAWSRRAEVTCDRAALIASRDLDATISSMTKLALGADTGTGITKYAELFRSHPNVAKRVEALKLFADSALYMSMTGGAATGKPSLSDIDKQVGSIISVL